MDAVAAGWVVGSFLLVLVSVGVCGWTIRATPSHPSSNPPNLFGKRFVLFLGFFEAGVGAYFALAYWLGRAGGFWAVTGIVAVVMISLVGCVWVARSTRKEPSSFDGYPFVGFIVVGLGALVALACGLEGLKG